ncbi:DUF4186 domain-containing protein [Komagataeibacter sp. FNDCR2]|uniref:DUF4186 domain-containing protein n=1 Tax=Komagataeibacter sp. FNDCR2 TaxID=2878682 RepID=UPI001E3D8135|nr:DUF4186 domain-containing protein [Komagataeibacter sp. FNDCR2]MCE2576188.1 DUF4186 domain-containing protein [Komagataeibacter sp. FNDCR2]
MPDRRAGQAPARQGDLFAPPPRQPVTPPEPPPVAPELWTRLAGSRFRARFHLGKAEHAYLASRGMAEVMAHAATFITTRLAPAHPARDGRQTPWRGHPVFIAQHATGTCCRGCVAKWHAIPAGQPLDAGQQAYLLAVIREWLRRDQARTAPESPGPARR